MNRRQKSEHFCSSHFGCFHRAGARPANYRSKPIINVRDRSISINATDCSGTFCSFDFADEENCVFIKGREVRIGWRAPLGAQRGGFSMVKMSLDPVQVMSGQVKELKVAPSSNGDSRGSWEEKEEFDQDHLGLSTKPKPVSVIDHS